MPHASYFLSGKGSLHLEWGHHRFAKSLCIKPGTCSSGPAWFTSETNKIVIIFINFIWLNTVAIQSSPSIQAMHLIIYCRCVMEFHQATFEYLMSIRISIMKYHYSQNLRNPCKKVEFLHTIADITIWSSYSQHSYLLHCQVLVLLQQILTMISISCHFFWDCA